MNKLPFLTPDEHLSLIGPQTSDKARATYRARLKDMGMAYKENDINLFYSTLVLIFNTRQYGWIDKIIERGFDPQTQITKDKRTLLNIALQHDNPVYLESLMSRYNLNVNAPKDNGETALFQAACITDTTSFETLLNYSPNVNHKSLSKGHLGLTIVSKQYHTSGIHLLNKIKALGFNLWFDANNKRQNMLTMALNQALPEYVEYIAEQAKNAKDMAYIEQETDLFFNNLSDRYSTRPWVRELKEYLKIKKEQSILNDTLPTISLKEGATGNPFKSHKI